MIIHSKLHNSEGLAIDLLDFHEILSEVHDCSRMSKIRFEVSAKLRNFAKFKFS